MRKIIVSIAIAWTASWAQANVVGSDAQNFNPTTSGLDFVTVQSARTLEPQTINIGFFLNYSVNTLSFLKNAGPNYLNSNDRLLSSDLNIGYGLAKNWDIGLSAPAIIKQDISNDNNVSYFGNTGWTEVRANTKYRFYNTEAQSWAVVLSANHNVIGNNPYAGIGGGPTYNFELAWLKKLGDSWLGINIGHRWRNPGTSLASIVGFDPLPNQWIYSAAWSRKLTSTDLKLILEAYGSTPATKTQDVNLSSRERSNLEGLIGVKQDYSENLSLHAGGGFGLQRGFATPDYRLYAGLNWTAGPSTQSETLQDSPNLKVFVLSNLKFKFDSDELTDFSQIQLEKVIANIKEISGVSEISVEGHTDASGAQDYNQKLSERRAIAIKKSLAAKVPFDSTKISAEGFGKLKPIADNDNYQGRAMNRRVIITVRSKGGLKVPVTK